jgi:UDP-N-acetyl-D-mannosaminuronic acid dehydrogenase
VIISVIGLGYIGLPTAAVLASRGINVVGVDVQQEVVDMINQGKIHIVEPGLEALVHSSVRAGKFRATVETEKADAFLIAVPTPFMDGHKPDLTYVQASVRAIAKVLEKGNLIVLESTSPVGTTEQMIDWLCDERPDLSFPIFCSDEESDIAIAYCPERVLPGCVVRELIENDRIIGGVTPKCADLAQKLYKIFVEARCFITDCRTAELSKLVENSFRDVNIAFANELSLISDKLKINVWELIRLANRHPRVDILQPGPGVGGHCIAVDPWFIVDSAPLESRLIRTARIVNDSKPEYVLNKVKQAIQILSKELIELRITCLGLSFKPDIDDLRESPALDIAKQIGLMGFIKNYIVEPNIKVLPKGFDVLTNELCDLELAIEVSDIVVLLVDHTSFKAIDMRILSGKQVIDTRGVLNDFNCKNRS